jgi:drug/metabolite transporter (DMT)-like permease
VTLNVGILLALACAVATQLAFLLKHRGANEAPAIDVRRPLASAASLFRSKWFAIGMATATGAWMLHVAALALAPLSAVQAVLSTGVVVLAVMAQRIFGFGVSRRQWAGVAMTTAGLLLLIATLPAAGAHSSYSTAAMAAFEAGLLLLGTLLVCGPRLGAPAQHHGVMHGAAAGLLFGVSDIAIKALTGVDDVTAILLSPWLGITIVASVVAFYASARGMQQAPPVPVIAATSTAANVACILGGIVVFGDPVASDAPGVVLQGVAFAMVAMSAVAARPGAAQPQTPSARLA